MPLLLETVDFDAVDFVVVVVVVVLIFFFLLIVVSARYERQAAQVLLGEIPTSDLTTRDQSEEGPSFQPNAKRGDDVEADGGNETPSSPDGRTSDSGGEATQPEQEQKESN